MKYNVIGYSNEVIGQVEAAGAVEAWTEAGKRFENILDVRETETVTGWKEPFVFRGLKFREHSEGIGMQVYHSEQKKWYDIEGLNWRTSKDYYSHQPDVGLWRDRSYFGSIRFPEPPF